jgi:hypothetical protein
VPLLFRRTDWILVGEFILSQVNLVILVSQETLNVVLLVGVNGRLAYVSILPSV